MNIFFPQTILPFIVLLIRGYLFYRAGEFDNAWGILWAAVSMVVFAFTWLYLHDGWLGMGLSQLTVLIGIAVVRAAMAYRDRDK